MIKNTLIHVILVNYNGDKFNIPCLHSIFAQEDISVDIILVDNASTDESVKNIQHVFGNNVHILLQSKNFLFAAACNIGFRTAFKRNAKYIFCINNDTVTFPDCLQRLYNYLEKHSTVAAVQPLLTQLNNPQKIASAGCLVSKMGGCWDKDCGKSISTLSGAPFPVPGITGGASLWRAEALRHIGLFDEDFGMYFEDVDLSLRARKLGYALYTVPEARVQHAVSATTNQAPAGFCVRYCQTNALRLILKHWPQSWLWKDCCFWLLTSVGALLANLLHKKWSTAKAIGLGTLHGLTLLPRGILFRLRNPLPENDALMPWINRNTPYPPPPES